MRNVALSVLILTFGALLSLPSSSAWGLGAGQVRFADANDDGYLNADEYADLDTKSVPVNWMSPGSAFDDALDTTSGSFLDASNVSPGSACGPFPLTTSSSEATDGWLNQACASLFAEGATIKWVVEWTDVDGGAGTVVSPADSIVKDLTAPAASITLNTDPDHEINTPDINNGITASWTVAGTGPAATVRVANDGQAAPADCVYSGVPRSSTAGITSACFAALNDGPLDVFVTGADVAGNTTTAVEPNELLLDRAGDLAKPGVSFASDFANKSNYTAMGVALSGAAGAPYALSVDDAGVAGTAPLVRTGTFGPTGTVSFTLNLGTLTDGTITAVATQTDGDGNPSAPASDTLSKDVAVPGAPVIDSPAPASLNSAAILKASGTAEKSTTVVIYVEKGTNDQRSVTTTADANGAWSAVLPTRAPDKGFGQSGTYTIYALSIDGAGNSSLPSDNVTFDLDIDMPVAVIEAPGNQTVFGPEERVLMSGQAFDPTELAFGQLVAVELNVFSPITPDVDADVKPNTANPGKTTYTYKLALGKSVLQHNATCKGTDVAQTPCAQSHGPREAVWSYDLSDLPPGPYTVQARALDIAGNWSAQYATVNFIKL
jgi:hypothetical protein